MKNANQKSIHELAREAEIALRNARAKVVMSHPFFGALLLKQKLVATTDTQTLATNGKELFFNPEYILSQRPEYLQFDCAHEALHPGLNHHTRRGERRFDWWNEACDYAINPILVEAGFHMPEGALLRDDFRGKGAEEIFRTLTDERGPEGPDGPDGPEGTDGPMGGDGPGDGPGSGKDASQPPPTPQPLPPESGDGDGGDGDGDGEQPDSGDAGGDGGDAGSDGQGQQPGAGGSTQVPSFGGTGAVLDAPVDNEVERKAEENEWKVAAIQAANLAEASKTAGNLPGDLIRQLEAMVKPKANWRELLRRFMDQFATGDYTWSKGNRRFLGQGLYLPSLQSDQLPPILFVVDASGSMPNEALDQAAGELQAIIDELKPEFVDVVVHDTEIRGEVQRFEPGDDLDIEVHAGGGTAFAPTCDWINEADEDYAVVVWFTDLYTYDWDECVEPEAPVIFIDWTAGEDREDECSFGEEVIPLEDDWS